MSNEHTDTFVRKNFSHINNIPKASVIIICSRDTIAPAIIMLHNMIVYNFLVKNLITCSITL